MSNTVPGYYMWATCEGLKKQLKASLANTCKKQGFFVTMEEDLDIQTYFT